MKLHHLIKITYGLIIVTLTACSEHQIAQLETQDATFKKAEKSTFIIVPITNEKKISEEKAEKFYSQNCLKKDLMPQLILTCKELKDCEGDSCVSKYGTHGTAFLYEEEDLLVTAWHVLYQSHAVYFTMLGGAFKRYTIEERRQKFLNGASPGFVLMNSNKEVIYSTENDTEDKDTEYEFVGDPVTTYLNQNGKNYDKTAFGFNASIPQDVVAIRLTRKLGPALNRAKTTREDLKRVGSIGYGYDNVSYDIKLKWGEEEALENLKHSIANYLPFYLDPEPIDQEMFSNLSLISKLRFMGYSRDNIIRTFDENSVEVVKRSLDKMMHLRQRHLDDYRLEEENDSVHFSSIPIFGGDSGAPLIDPEGNVLGIVTTGMVRKNSKQPEAQLHSYGAGSLLFKEHKYFSRF